MSQILAQSSDNDERGDTANWVIDYDGSSTIGITVTSAGSLSKLQVWTKQIASGKAWLVDCVNGPAGTQTANTNLPDGTSAKTWLLGPVSGQGRQVLLGPGSVIGEPTSIPPAAVPQPVKGQQYPFLFGDIWAP